MHHPSGIPQKIVNKVVARRGRLHAFESVTPETTALVGIDPVLIAGTVTNICCESSARDAAELEYKVILVSDALSGHAHGLHEATLATFDRIFGDVRPGADIIELLHEEHQALLHTTARNRQ